MNFRSFAKRSLLLLWVLFAASVAAFWIAPPVALCGLILLLLLIVARYDNSSGTWLPIAVLFVIAIGIVAFLLFGMAVIHALISG